MKFLIFLLLPALAIGQDNFKATSVGAWYWQRQYEGSKNQAIEAIYTNFTIRNNVIADLDSVIFFDYEDKIIKNPKAAMTSVYTIIAKVRIEFKEERYRVTLLNIQDQLGRSLREIQIENFGQFNKIKEAMNRDLPNLFEPVTGSFNDPW